MSAASLRMPKRKNVSREFIDDSDDPEDTGGKTKQARVEAGESSGASRDDEMIKISPKRFVSVRMFKGKFLVDIREFWEDDSGERKPGRKGISLTLDQWEKLKAAVPEIDRRIHGRS